jgi:RNase H-like domain found in reverse transcriptase/Reverse transcriptase (RNA-dependent DNA polymerase)/Integrase core domain/Integrase zinc binding domain/Chromo (CHRromatin Organisation MOdifier) domain
MSSTFVLGSPPSLTQTSVSAVVTFMKARDAYLSLIADAKRTNPTLLLSEPTLIQSVDADLLAAWVLMGEFEGVDKIEDLTAEKVQTLLDSIVSQTTTRWSPETVLSEVRKHVHMDPRERNPKIRAMSCVSSYVRLAATHKWNFPAKNPKLAVEHIVAVLKPHELKERVESELQMSYSDLYGDFKAFVKYLKRVSVETEVYHALSDKTKRLDMGKPNGKSGSSPAGVGENRKGKNRSSYVSPTSQSDSSSVTRGQCFKCGDGHLVARCPIATEQEKKDLVHGITTRSGRRLQARGSGSAVSGSLDTRANEFAVPIPAPAAKSMSAQFNEGLYIVLNGISFRARADSGADVVAITKPCLERLGDMGMFTPIKRCEPLSLRLADSDPVTVTQICKISPALRVKSGREIILHGLQAYVLEVAEGAEEILLGEPFLRRLDIDVASQLSDAVNDLEVIDCSMLDPLWCPTSEVSSKLAVKLLEVNPLNFRMADDMLHQRITDTDSRNDPAVQDFSQLVESDPIEDEVDGMDLRNENAAETEISIGRMAARAKDMCPDKFHSQLLEIVRKHREVFRTSLGDAPAMQVEPMHLSLRNDAVPVKARARTYPTRQVAFMESKTRELEASGFIYRNPGSPWVSAPLCVPKPKSPEGYRLTIDLRDVNSQVQTAQWPMPTPEAQLGSLSGSSWFCSFDLLHGYWQLPLATDSQALHSFQTPLGVYSPRRVIQGGSTAVSFMQSTMESMFSDFEQILIWLDDILLHASDADEMLQHLDRFLTRCKDKRIFLHPDKCDLMCKEAKFCGRVIDKNGYRFHPRTLAGITEALLPVFAAELVQFCAAANWMRTSIADYARLVLPLQEKLEREYKTRGSRKKVHLAKVRLQWSSDEREAFESVRLAVTRATVLALPKPTTHEICLFTDASDRFYGGILTQVPNGSVRSGSLPAEWQHEPLAFVSGAFRGAQIRWSTPEKEAFAVTWAVVRLGHILARCTFELFSDHRNLAFLLNPHRSDRQVARYVVNKISRWALRLSEFSFNIHHVTGDMNVWADLLSRWSHPTYHPAAVHSLAALMAPAPTEGEIGLPCRRVLQMAQMQATESPPEKFSQATDGVWHKNNVIWVASEEARVRCCVAAHFGLGGHRGFTTTLSVLKPIVFWCAMEEDVRSFVQSCLHCLSSMEGNKVPRPLASQEHSMAPNEIIHFDFLYVAPCSAGEYCLVMKDDFTNYVQLFHAANATASVVADALSAWFALFGLVRRWTSDQGSHFRNAVIEDLAARLGARHHFVTSYCPWANGSVEVLNRVVLRTLRALLSEFQMSENDWPRLLPLVQLTMNTNPSRRLKGRTPLEVMTGRRPEGPLMAAVSWAPPGHVDDGHLRALMDIDCLSDTLSRMHKDLAEVISDGRKRQIDAFNRKTHVQQENFDVGDYVLVPSTGGNRSKLSPTWVGPRRIIAVRPHKVCLVEDLLTKSQATVHVSHMRLYRDALQGTGVNMLKLAEFGDRQQYAVEKLLSIRTGPGDVLQIRVRWRGYTSRSDTWEPLDTLLDDVPELVREFLRDLARTNRDDKINMLLQRAEARLQLLA